MSDEISIHSGALKIQVHCIVDDIDEDDRDALRVVIEVTNEGVNDATHVDAKMRTMDGGKVEPFEYATEISAGMRHDFSYFVSADSGAWLFKMEHNSDGTMHKAELGPYSCEIRIQETFRKPIDSQGKGSAVGGSIFEAAFDTALTGFGDEAPIPAAAPTPTSAESDPLASAFSNEMPASTNLVAPAQDPISAPAEQSEAATPATTVESPPQQNQIANQQSGNVAPQAQPMIPPGGMPPGMMPPRGMPQGGMPSGMMPPGGMPQGPPPNSPPNAPQGPPPNSPPQKENENEEGDNSD